MINWLDDKILSAHQRFADTCQTWTGISKFKLAKWSLILWGLITVYGIIIIFFLKGQYFVFGCIFSTFVSLLVVAYVNQIEDAERRFNRTGELWNNILQDSKTRVPLVVMWMMVIAMDVFLLRRFDIDVIGRVSLVSHIYFTCCLPKPPSKSKIKKLYEAALRKISDALDSEPEPSFG